MAKSTLFGSCKKKCIAIGKIKITLNGGGGGGIKDLNNYLNEYFRLCLINYSSLHNRL